MKRILAPILLALTFSVMFSSASFAEWKVPLTEWKKITVGGDGTTYYLSEKSIKPKGRYVEWWGLNDRLKPTSNGFYSAAFQQQGECASFRYRSLSVVLYPKKMQGRHGRVVRNKNPKWVYPRPNSIDGHFLKIVCAYAK
jgi:hypothetical protein